MKKKNGLVTCNVLCSQISTFRIKVGIYILNYTMRCYRKLEMFIFSNFQPLKS